MEINHEVERKVEFKFLSPFIMLRHKVHNGMMMMHTGDLCRPSVLQFRQGSESDAGSNPSFVI